MTTTAKPLPGSDGRSRDDLERDLIAGAEQLRLAEQSFRTLVENIPDVIARFDADLRPLYISPAVESVTGRPAGDLVGKSDRDLGLPAALAESWQLALRRVFATAKPERLDFSLASPDGERHFDCRLVPEPGPGGPVASVLSVARDVTDHWQAGDAERHARSVAEELREATVALTRSLDRETVLASLLDRLRPLVPFDRGRVMLLDGGSRVSVRAIFDGERVVPLAPEERPAFEAADHPVLQGILASGTALLIPDVHVHPGWSLPTEDPTETSWMGIPLFVRGAVAGLFSLSKREVDYFNGEHVRLAEAMSRQASIAVENAVLFEQMQASAARMKLLSRRLVDVQESERRRISRELHDEAGQALASLRYGLRLLERDIEQGASVTSRVADLMQRTDAVIDGLHRLAADLRPASLDHLGLEAALAQYLRSVGSRFELAVRFKPRGFSGERLPAAIETALFRVVQEAVTNVVRHARASRIDVLAERRGDRVLVMVEDDGIGFEPGRTRGGESFGLLGIRERAEALGGSLTIESAPGAGTTIVVEVTGVDPAPDR